MSFIIWILIWFGLIFIPLGGLYVNPGPIYQSSSKEKTHIWAPRGLTLTEKKHSVVIRNSCEHAVSVPPLGRHVLRRISPLRVEATDFLDAGIGSVFYEPLDKPVLISIRILRDRRTQDNLFKKFRLRPYDPHVFLNRPILLKTDKMSPKSSRRSDRINPIILSCYKFKPPRLPKNLN